MYHDEIKTRKTTVENGKTTFIKREKYCAVHGWFDLAIINETDWNKSHLLCGTDSESGNGAEIEMPKVMKKAA